jgi:hypothetical protein
VIALFCAPIFLGSQCSVRAAPTERHDVTETYFAATVTDHYRWLAYWQEGKAADGLKTHDTYTRAQLAAIPAAGSTTIPGAAGSQAGFKTSSPA